MSRSKSFPSKIAISLTNPSEKQITKPCFKSTTWKKVRTTVVYPRAYSLKTWVTSISPLSRFPKNVKPLL